MNKNLTLEEKEAYLTKLAVEVDYTHISILPAPDKEVTNEKVIDDMISLFEAILEERYTGKPVGTVIFTTEGK